MTEQPELDVTLIEERYVENLQAVNVDITRSGVQNITSTKVDFHQGAVGNIQAEEVSLTQGAGGIVETVHFQVSDGGVGIVRAQDAVVANCGVLFLFGDQIDMSDSYSSLIVAQEVKAEKINTKVLLAGTVEGNVETVFDTPRALLAGLAAGGMVGVVLLISQLLKKKK